MGQTVTVEQLLETYKRNKKECLESEYSDWVKAIDRALLTGETRHLETYGPKVVEVYEIIKAERTTSFSDELK
jgi:hypothetical protein